MKNDKRRTRTPNAYRAREREVQHEIRSFLSALVSYPDGFARDPRLSFEKYLFRLAATNRLANYSERRRS